MSLPEGGFDSREKSGGRRTLVWCAVVAALVVGWAWLVLGWGGSVEESPGKHTGEEVARSGGTGDDGSGAAGEDDKDSGASSVPDGAAHAGSGGGDSFSLDGSMTGGSGDGLAGGSPGVSGGWAARGATNEPGVYDPLGTGASSGDLALTEKERVRYAAEKFVMAAYGYSGDDPAEYLKGVAATSLSPDLSLSAGGEEISRYAEQVEKSGTKSAAVLTDFEFTDTSEKSVTGMATFKTGEGYGADGELTGERLAYKQTMTLSRMGATWKVRTTEEIEQTTPDEEER